MADPDHAEPSCADALIAGTLAAMTCWASPCEHASLGPEDQRRLLARKVVSNLYFLREHPGLCPSLRQVAGEAHRRWVEIALAGNATSADTADASNPSIGEGAGSAATSRALH